MSHAGKKRFENGNVKLEGPVGDDISNLGQGEGYNISSDFGMANVEEPGRNGMYAIFLIILMKTIFSSAYIHMMHYWSFVVKRSDPFSTPKVMLRVNP